MIRSILDIASQVSTLKKCGKDTLRGLCPFHNEKTPSFFINTDRNTFKCFGCGKGGGVRDLLILTGQVVEDAEARKMKMKNQFEEQLANYLSAFTNSFKAQAYIKSRGFTGEQARQFNIGYDERHQCVVFPIYDESMSPIAFSFGFIVKHEPKYLHSVNFSKSLHFFAYYDQMKSKDSIWVVEGFFDVLRMYASNYDTVGIMGSYVSTEQAEKLCTWFDNRTVVLMLDGDWAGFCGAIKSYCLLKSKGAQNVLFFNWQTNIDPDELLKDSAIDLKSYVVDIHAFITSAMSRFPIQDVISIISQSDISLSILKYICISRFKETKTLLHLEPLRAFEHENKSLADKIRVLLKNNIELSIYFRLYIYLTLDSDLQNQVEQHIDNDLEYENINITIEISRIIKKLKILHIKYELYNLKRGMEVASFLNHNNNCDEMLNQYLQLKKDLLKFLT